MFTPWELPSFLFLAGFPVFPCYPSIHPADLFTIDDDDRRNNENARIDHRVVGFDEDKH